MNLPLIKTFEITAPPMKAHATALHGKGSLQIEYPSKSSAPLSFFVKSFIHVSSIFCACRLAFL